MTPVGVFFCWQGGAERDFVNSAILSQSSIAEFVLTSHKAGFGEAPQQAFLQPAGMQK